MILPEFDWLGFLQLLESAARGILRPPRARKINMSITKRQKKRKSPLGLDNGPGKRIELDS
jgi:hypothetical protein